MVDKRESLITPALDRCFVCGSRNNIHIHEIFFGPNRKKSIEDKMTVSLCGNHHNLSNAGVHFNKQLDNYLKQYGERV